MGRITTIRGDQVIREPTIVPDQNNNPPQGFEDTANFRMAMELQNIATKTFDYSRPVDEYRCVLPGGLAAVIPAVYPNGYLEVLPEYEVPEMINTVFLSAPAASTVTLVLGTDFQVQIIMSAQAYQAISFGPHGNGIRLNRDDRRLLILGTNGPCSLRLTGHADLMG